MTLPLFDTQFALNIGPWEQDSLVPCLTKMTSSGYNGIEITAKTFENFGDRVEILKEITRDVGIEVVSYVLKMDFDQVAANSAQLDQFTRLAGFVRHVGGTYIIVEQGFRAQWQSDVEGQLVHFERVITDFSGICADNNVELIYHPTPDSFIRTTEVMDRVVELIYPLGCRICFDIGDFLTMGVHPIQFMQKYLDAIRVIHLNDIKILKGKKAWMLHPPEKMVLGQGKVDLKSIWLFLQAMEFKGWIVAESPSGLEKLSGIDVTTQYLNRELEVFLTNTI